jgi:hypothetical protein
MIRRALLAFLSVALALLLASLQTAALAQHVDGHAQTDREILVMVRLAPDHYRPGGTYGGAYADQLGQSARQHAAREVARKYGLKLVDNWPMPMIGVDCFVMLVPDGRSTSATANAISHDDKVSWAQPMTLFTAQSAQMGHNDPLYAAQPDAAKWHLGDLHRISDGRGTRVAVVDSGIDAGHPDLSGQVVVNRNFVSGQALAAEQHGTAVAGIIAAKADNKIGIAGVAPGARLLGLRACWQAAASRTTQCDTLSLAKALYFAVESRADIINLSLSGPDDRLLREIISLALKRRLAVVAAFDPKLGGGGFPASVSGVIPVSDTSLAGSRAQVYIAPGHDVPTTEPGGRWFLVNGSSFAAAHVSGLLALVRERSKSAPVLVSERRGGGVIDACATLIRAAGACDCSCGSNRFTVSGDHR